MSQPVTFPALAAETLETVAGGAARKSAVDAQTQAAIQSITDSLDSLKQQRQQGGDQLTKWLPMMMMARAMR